MAAGGIKSSGSIKPSVRPQLLRASHASNGACARVVILDATNSIADRARAILRKRGYDCEVSASAREAEALIAEGGVSTIVCNALDPEFDRSDFVASLRRQSAGVSVLLIGLDPDLQQGAPASTDARVACLPALFDERDLADAVSRLAESTNHNREFEQLYRDALSVKKFVDRARDDVGLIAQSPQTALVVFFAHRVAPTRAAVLVEGETGTGKELIARLLHCWSHRSAGPFVALNCKAMPEGTLESEIFGHERGSFTGAVGEHAGCFERASGGTLFLDEIGETTPDFQAKLLRVLETGELLRVGGSVTRKVDVRVVAATNRILKQEVAAGRFREDLYFRLNVINLRLPPLRERPEDILPLAQHFLSKFQAESGRSIRLTPEVERRLLVYRWPGNVRELQNTIHRAVVLSTGEVIDTIELESQPMLSEDEVGVPMEGTLHEFTERAKAQRIRAALAKANGNHSLAADELGINRATLYRLIQRLEI